MQKSKLLSVGPSRPISDFLQTTRSIQYCYTRIAKWAILFSKVDDLIVENIYPYPLNYYNAYNILRHAQGQY